MLICLGHCNVYSGWLMEFYFQIGSVMVYYVANLALNDV